MPEGIVRTDLNITGISYRNGFLITLPHDFGNTVSWPPSPTHFGNPVTWAVSPTHFGNIVTWLVNPAHFGNVVANGAATYSISGTISGVGGARATVTLSGSASAVTTADGSGNYSFTGLSNGLYLVTPSNAGYVFTPINESETISGGGVTGANFVAVSGFELEDGSGVILLESGDILLLEIQ